MDSFGLRLAELELRRMIDQCSNLDQATIEAVSSLPEPERHAAVACWLRPPVQSEIETMPDARAAVVREMWRVRCKSILALADILRDRLRVDGRVAQDLARGIAGVSALHRSMAKGWGVSERQYYRLVHAASREVGRLLFAVVRRVALANGDEGSP